METEIKRYEELGKIMLGQKVIVFNEGVMKYIGSRTHNDIEIGTTWSNPVFLSEVNENGEIKYKEIEVLTKSYPIATWCSIFDKNNVDYNQVRKQWRNLK